MHSTSEDITAKEDMGSRRWAGRIVDYVVFDLPLPEPDLTRSDSEDEAEYTKGGYHRVKLGDKFDNGRYTVIGKLGWGHFSTVWHCHDAQRKQDCAIKVQKSGDNYAEAARDEITLLHTLKSRNPKGERPVVEILDHFELSGPNGVHICLTFELLGKSLLSLIRRSEYKGIPVNFVKVIGRQILDGLRFCHEDCHIIHTDLKPENVLFVPSSKRMEHCEQQSPVFPSMRTGIDGIDGIESISVMPAGDAKNLTGEDLEVATTRVKIVDFGNACWTFHHYTDDIQTRQYRAPEVILGAGYDSRADMWSLACLLFELATGDFLFDPQRGKDYDRDEDHLALMMELLGPIPPELIKRGTHSHEFFTNKCKLRHISKLAFWNLRDVLREKYKMSSNDAIQLSGFLLPMLHYAPEQRPSAREALQHPFVNGPRTLAACRHRRNSTRHTSSSPLFPVAEIQNSPVTVRQSSQVSHI